MAVTLGEAAGNGKMLMQNELTKMLKPKIEQLAAVLQKAKTENRFVLVRFHHDADGISATFALSEVLRFFAQQQNSAVYTVKDAIRDLSVVAHEEKPLITLLDFGMNAESAEGLNLIKAGGIELIVIDHHPPSKEAMGIPDFYLTPWEFSNENDTSRYVAGYLVAEVAVACGGDGDKCRKYAKTACAGDKSDLMDSDDEDKKRALVLDYLAANSGYGNNLKFYKTVLKNDELFQSMYTQAIEKIDDAAERAMKSMKERKFGDGKIYLVELERLVKKGEFPNRSKITTRIFEKLKSDKPAIVIGTGKRMIILRVNDAAVEMGAGANKIAEMVSGSMGDFVESGGGHVRAGAIKVKEGFVDSVVNAILKDLTRGIG